MTDLVRGLANEARQQVVNALTKVVLVGKARAEKQRIREQQKALDQELIALCESFPQAEDAAAKAVAVWRKLEARRATLVVPGYWGDDRTKREAQNLSVQLGPAANACRATKGNVERIYGRIAQLEEQRRKLDDDLKALGLTQLMGADKETLIALKEAMTQSE